MKKTIISSYLEFIVLAVISLVYFYGIALLARTTLLFEISFCIILPILIYFSKTDDEVKTHRRIIELIIIESFFLLVVIASKASIYFENLALNSVVGYAFLLFFLAQTFFFLLYQYKIKTYFGMLRSILLLVMILFWFAESEKSSLIDEQGRFLFWNGNASLAIQVYYCFWFVGVILVDSVLLPNYRQVVPHSASVVVSLWSGEFFHIRLLTACHLFVLDFLFSYTSTKNITEDRSSFCIITDQQQIIYDVYIRKLLDWITLLVCMLIFILHLL
ncbi:hypothetical protein [Agarilytica rhodophyticola]|uniref:hypothetical protein n=1 Tax=Agarilytica rhodophyticola TaxID=1737490 RepID=UPI000B341061|nr:hypothetical protein [Agarilytica rhodophyticola]